MNNTIQAIVLAAGRGTRMNATVKNKVMYEIGGKPMIAFPISALKGLGIEKPIVVVGFAKDSVTEYLKDQVIFAEQVKAEGTADAVRAAIPFLAEKTEHVIVLYGDHSTFYTTQLLQQLMKQHIASQAAMTLITTHTDPTGYGRILRDKQGKMIGIVEEKNATHEQKKITEINTGNAVYSMEFLSTYLPQVRRNPVSGEFYFTDIVELGVQHQEKVETYTVNDKAIGMGINTPQQLQEAEAEMNKRQA